jgi:protein-disulfide isomerase
VDSQIEIPAAAPEPHNPSPESPAVVVIPRTVFNYGVIAVVCLIAGILIGLAAYDRVAQQNLTTNEMLIQRAVATAVAALPRESVAEADPDERKFVAVDNQPSLGAADAPVVMVEFGDFRCTYCKRFYDETITPLLENYGDKIQFVFRDYPILGASSVQAALAASCAYDQNAFWDFHDRLFAAPTELTRDKFLEYAQALNLDMDRFTACYDDAQSEDGVVQDYNDAVALGVTGTPTFFINGKVMIGAQPYDAFATAIDAEIARVEASMSDQAS